MSISGEFAAKGNQGGIMVRRGLACLLVLGILAACLPGAARGASRTDQTNQERPNVVVFLSDDAGWGDFGISGNRQVATPRIDSIGRRGVRFRSFYVCPVCAPTRAEFLTGRYHARGGVRGVSTGWERLDLEERTLADAFQAAGYATGAFGKWHNGSQWPYHPRARGFDEYFGHTAGHWGEYFDPPLEEDGRMVRVQGYIVDVCVDRALAFIDQSHRNQHPFFCYIPFTTPHTPWAAPEEDWRRWATRPITQRGLDPSRENLDETRCALAMLENQDRNVGRVLDRLESLGLTRKTIVVFFSDNGPNTARWNEGLKGRKGSLDEGGVRSVCLMSWPGCLPEGREVDRISGAIDLAPTLLSLTGVPRVGERPFDGRDLTPLLTATTNEAAATWPDRVLVTTWGGRLSLRDQRYRLDPRGELYDLQADPGQTRPVTRDQPEVAARLTRKARRWREELLGAEGDALNPARLNQTVDPRPIPLGYPAFPITMLPARDGSPEGSVKRSSSAPNCSYFVEWAGLDARMTWKVAVRTSGRYRVTIDYTCPEADVGSLIELSLGERRLTGRVGPAWDPPLYDNQDTLPRPPAESRMKPFRTLDLGVLTLDQGEGDLVLRALEIPGRTVMDVRRVTLTLLPSEGERTTEGDPSRQ